MRTQTAVPNGIRQHRTKPVELRRETGFPDAVGFLASSRVESHSARDKTSVLSTQCSPRAPCPCRRGVATTTWSTRRRRIPIRRARSPSGDRGSQERSREMTSSRTRRVDTFRGFTNALLQTHCPRIGNTLETGRLRAHTGQIDRCEPGPGLQRPRTVAWRLPAGNPKSTRSNARKPRCRIAICVPVSSPCSQDAIASEAGRPADQTAPGISAAVAQESLNLQRNGLGLPAIR